MSTETTKKKIKIDNGTEFAKVYTDKQTDSKLTAKQDVLTAGTNITIKDNVISASGGSIAATALTNEDLDTLKTEGSYYAGGSNTCTNKPTGIDAFGLTIKRVASGYYTQYLTGGNTNTGQVYTRTFTSGAWTSWIKFTQDTQLATKQDRLVSGTNIKSINGNSLLGSGDLTIESGGTYTPLNLTLTQDSKDENLFTITLTDSQIQTLAQAINKESIIAYATFAYNGIDFTIPISLPTIYETNNENIYSGTGSIFYIANAINLSFYWTFNITTKTLSVQANNNVFSSSWGVYIDLNPEYTNSLMFATGENTLDIVSMQGDHIFFDTINGKSILHTDSTINEYTIPDTKTISLFGNHSILVPKDSTDTNIDLYNHAIEISGTTSGNYDYSIWFNVVSSKNLVVDSLTDLKTLLGNTFKREVFGFSNTSTTPTAIIGIDETQMYNTNGETTSFANLSSITFTDTVTTI